MSIRNIISRLLPVLLLSAGAASTATAQLYHAGEVLNYRVSYKARLFPNTEVATVSIKTTAEELDGKPCYKVTGNGRTMPAWRWFFNMDDTYRVWADTVTLLTQRFESDIREGNYTFRSRFDYDWERMQVHTRWQKRQNAERAKTMNIGVGAMDAVSLYFNLRGVDTDTFREGDSRSLEMVLEDTIRSLDFRFVGREVKKVPKLGKYNTLKFKCQIGTSDGFSFTDGTEFTVWISDDGNKVPLYLESPIRVGSICAYISSVAGLKYPLGERTKR